MPISIQCGLSKSTTSYNKCGTDPKARKHAYALGVRQALLRYRYDLAQRVSSTVYWCTKYFPLLDRYIISLKVKNLRLMVFDTCRDATGALENCAVAITVLISPISQSLADGDTGSLILWSPVGSVDGSGIDSRKEYVQSLKYPHFSSVSDARSCGWSATICASLID